MDNNSSSCINHNSALPFWEQPESRRLEFKEKFPKGAQVAKTAIAFANGAGGRIVFGVRDEPRRVLGIPDDEVFALEERISSHIFSQCASTIIPEIYIQSVEGKNLLVVEIFPGSHKQCHYSQGLFHSWQRYKGGDF